MTGTPERRYRRVLRLLPAGYRQAWEEDMVGAYLERARAGRPSPGELLSVLALAVRLRLTGTYASARGRAWRQAAHMLALMILLYQALAATVSVASTVALAIESTVDEAPVSLGFFVWSDLLTLFWVATFGALVLGRVVAAWVLAALAFASHVGVTVATYVIVTGLGSSGPGLGPADAIRWGWAVLSVAAALTASAPALSARRRWLGAYLAGGLILLAASPRIVVPRYPLWTHYANLESLTQVALVVAMAVALATTAWRRSPQWLLALAAFGGGLGAVHLVRRPAPVSAIEGEPVAAWTGTFFTVSTSLDLAVLSFAVVCAVIGLAALRRLPRPPLDEGATA